MKAKEIKLSGTPGKILKSNFTVACKENAIQILELKKEGKKKMLVSEFLKGNKINIGSQI